MKKLLDKKASTDKFDEIIRHGYSSNRKLTKQSVSLFLVELGVALAGIYLLIGLVDYVWYLLTCC